MKDVVKQNVSKVPKRYYYPLIGDYREFACGWAAAMINITVTFPVNKLIFRQVRHAKMIFHPSYMYLGSDLSTI